jgi:hypothetical protein
VFEFPKESVLKSFFCIVIASLLVAVNSVFAQPADNSTATYAPVPGAFPLTRWAKDVSPQRALPEYPRPQLVRKDWMSLNGLWDYAVVAKDAQPPASYQGKILVPFPIESPLSGVGKPIHGFHGRQYADSRLWYQRWFKTPSQWKDKRVLLHFGAVDWEATVLLNGKELGTHRGGYDAFSFDITDSLDQNGENRLVVAAWDPTGNQYPQGKQAKKGGGIRYTACTGIWQTVWLEPVPETSIQRLKMVPDVDKNELQLTVSVRGAALAATVRAEVFDRDTKVSEASGTAGAPIRLPVPNAKLWWPDSPFLYGLKVRIDSSKDAVESYFGMRKSSLGKDDKGITRMMLNNKFIVQNGVLDQGYWPDGNLTAPTDEALRSDVEAIKRLGFNMSRKHVKIEPERWYYWCDKLGLLVWQDMPSATHAGFREATWKQFLLEMEQMIEQRFNHPSIVSWVLFNEGWGIEEDGRLIEKKWFDLKAVTAKAIALDPTRLINHESGAGGGPNQGKNPFDVGAGHIIDFHCYGSLKAPRPEPDRAAVIGEYGYAKYLRTCQKYAPLVKDPGVSGYVWTQISDVENERNGLMTYDRSQFTEDPEKVAAENMKYYHEKDSDDLHDPATERPRPVKGGGGANEVRPDD